MVCLLLFQTIFESPLTLEDFSEERLPKLEYPFHMKYWERRGRVILAISLELTLRVCIPACSRNVKRSSCYSAQASRIFPSLNKAQGGCGWGGSGVNCIRCECCKVVMNDCVSAEIELSPLSVHFQRLSAVFFVKPADL